ncbi:MAG: exodeoxyribonuclease VII small subunit [Chlamydiae bacterium]|nr:exodeoxyribonuclease VII small subunit [Chlamydiota bacterium]MBI3265704.1 exodeoxyribonuclease VII small subunit [Chlamydiota bacterium]
MKQNSGSFEEAMKKLEGIVGFLENDEVSLDEALKKYEDGVKLVRFCTKKLEEAEKKIEVLTRDEEGKVVKKPFMEKNVRASNKGDVEESLLF